jgi:hypothetical protein
LSGTIRRLTFDRSSPRWDRELVLVDHRVAEEVDLDAVLRQHTPIIPQCRSPPPWLCQNRS